MALARVLLFGLAIVAGCAAEPSLDAGSSAEQAATTGSTDPSRARGDRIAASSTLYGRSVVLHASDPDGAAWASIDGGSPGDEVWLDRSFDNGDERQGPLVRTKIPRDRRGWRTQMVLVDDASRFAIGAVRACGKAGDRVEITCTPWVRSAKHDGDRLDRSMASLMALYDRGSGQWQGIGWWNSANALTAVIDYSERTGSQTYRYAIGWTFDRNKGDDFTNDFMDDTGWWGLAWVRAYELTREPRYLEMAKRDADWMWSFKDARCGGGVWWSDKKDYKNAITNELFIQLAAAIHNQIPGDVVYLARAQEIWRWFRASGMINGARLVNDGLDGATCKNNGQTTWTYNQGVILGALAELHDATGDAALLAEARALADASTAAASLHEGGILREPCEASAGPDACGKDGPSFKGIYVRNLGALDRRLPGRPYRAYLERQASALDARARGTLDTYGLRWGGPFDRADASRQHGAVDAFVAAKR